MQVPAFLSGKDKVTVSSEPPISWQQCKHSLDQEDEEHAGFRFETHCGALACSKKSCKAWMQDHEMKNCKLIPPARSESVISDEMTVYGKERDVFSDDNSSAGNPTTLYFQDVLDDKRELHTVEIPDIVTVPTLYAYIELIQTELSILQRKPFVIEVLLYKRDSQSLMPSSGQKGMLVPIENQVQFLQFKKNLAILSKKKPGQVTPHFTLQVTEKLEKVPEQALYVPTRKSGSKSATTTYGSTDRLPFLDVANNQQHPPDRESSMLASARRDSIALAAQATKKQKKMESNADHFSQQILILNPCLVKEPEFHELWLHGNLTVFIYN